VHQSGSNKKIYEDKATDQLRALTAWLREHVPTAVEVVQHKGAARGRKQGAAILDALELLDGETLKPRSSRYGKNVLDVLSQKGQSQVLNRSEMIASESGVDYWTKFRIEREFLSVVLAAPGP